MTDFVPIRDALAPIADAFAAIAPVIENAARAIVYMTAPLTAIDSSRRHRKLVACYVTGGRPSTYQAIQRARNAREWEAYAERINRQRVADAFAVADGWRKDGYDVIATRIAAKLGATMAVCASEDMAAWEAEIGIEGESRQTNGAT